VASYGREASAYPQTAGRGCDFARFHGLIFVQAEDAARGNECMQRFLSVALSLTFFCACSFPVHPSKAALSPEFIGSVKLYDRPLELRLSTPQRPVHSDVLVLYSTGDGGWRPLDESFIEWISSWGYPVAGFSAKNYLKNLRYYSKTTTPQRLVRDFELIMDAACQQLGLRQDIPVILVGMSRGAGLSVVAAGQAELRPRLTGVVAVALTKEEEHVVHYRQKTAGQQPGAPERELVEIKTYEYLTRLAPVPLMVIQSTRDRYVPASSARKLFGEDTEFRRFVPVESANHSFSGGTDILFRETEAALEWVQQVRAW
jgi:pimeloyl-ACP methyl ester carboxylesterase